MVLNILLVLIYLCLIKHSVSPPVDGKQKQDQNIDERLKEIGLEYQTYLQQVAKVLESDPDFVQRIQKLSPDKYESGEIANELQFVKHNVRTKLDELKRIEMDRIRKYAIAQMELTDLGMDRKRIKIPIHLDLANPHSFEIEDLKKLITATNKDMEEIAKRRKEEFKNYELEKEHVYREKLQQLNETDRMEEQKKHDQMIKKHKDHPKVHHPGSKPQLEQVWEEEDNLPKEEFDPEVFFSMHDLNGDNFLDPDEVEAIVAREISKIYDRNNDEDDDIERLEEFARMTEHIFNETDTNHDGLISKEEFLAMTKRSDFEVDEGWKGLDEELPFTDEELEEYERLVAKKKQEVLGNKDQNVPIPSQK